MIQRWTHSQPSRLAVCG